MHEKKYVESTERSMRVFTSIANVLYITKHASFVRNLNHSANSAAEERDVSPVQGICSSSDVTKQLSNQHVRTSLKQPLQAFCMEIFT